MLLRNNQVGKSPSNLLWERSRNFKLNWCKRKLGSVFKLQLGNWRTFSWYVGSQLSVVTWNVWLLDESSKTSSFEWLANELRENMPSKSFPVRAKYLSDVRLVKGEEKLPLNKLSEISRNWRLVKLFRHSESWPSTLFSWRTNLMRFFRPQIPESEKRRGQNSEN